MKPHFLIFLLITYHLSGQLTENFENSDISGWHESTANRWSFSPERPIAGNYSLHHVYDNSHSDHDQISFLHDPLILDSAIARWSFRIHYDYDPSAYNHWAVFLVSDKNASGMHPDGHCNGYILGVNYTGSDDLIRFWKSAGNKVSEITNTGFNWQTGIGKDKPVSFDIIRYQTGLWEFYLDTTSNQSGYIKIGEVEDSEMKISHFFGLYYKYTSGQDRRLWFDDLYINGFFIRDTDAPAMKAVHYTEKLQLTLQFNELITLTQDSKLEIQTGPETRYIDSVKAVNDKLLVWMRDPILNESAVSVKACHIQDIYGNMNSCESIMFFHYLPGFNDLIITEIMADPLPSTGLPEAEYLELYNRSNHSIHLKDWQICAGSECASFGEVTVSSGEYMILFDSHYPDIFDGLSGQLAMDHFPRISNNGQIIVLKDKEGNVIFSTEYHISWYDDDAKSDGGWSLEMIDYDNPCGGKNNWKASVNARGGTPGSVNSVTGYNPDNENPELLRSVIISDSSLYLHFNETVTGRDLYVNDNYLINNGLGIPCLSIPANDLLNAVILYFENKFKDHLYYSLQINNNPTDCTGNMLKKESTFTFRKPFQCDSMDLIINEILFDPLIPGGEFIEIYNRSMKTIDLEDFYIVLRDRHSGKPGPSYILSETPFTIEQGDYLVLTENTSLLSGYYHHLTNTDVLEMENIPNLPNEGAVISLFDPNDRIIDEVTYSTDMHVDIANHTKGVSLERIDPDGPSNNPGNWYSASGDHGYSTPGNENSQYRKDQLSSFSVIAEPEIMTPDGDGMNDATVIKYVAGDAGFFANIIVFDRTGRPLRILARNTLLGSSGEFTWDGKTVEGRMAPVGSYLIYTEIFNLTGSIKKFKNSCIVAEKIY